MRIVSSSVDGTVRLWDAVGGAPIGIPLKGHKGSVLSVAFSPDGSRVVSGGKDNTVRLWHGVSGAPIGNPMKGHVDSVLSVRFSSDGTRIVSGSADDTVRLWDLERRAAIDPPLEGNRAWVQGLAFSPDKTRIAFGGHEKVQVWDLENVKGIGALPEEEYYDVVKSVVVVAFSPDGTLIVSGNNVGEIQLWKGETGAAIGAPLRGHSEQVSSIAFSLDGAWFVSSSFDGTVQLWDAKRGAAVNKPLEHPNGFMGWVTSVAINQDGTRIVSGGQDGKVRLWDAKRGVAVNKPLEHSSGVVGLVTSVAFSPDGTRIVSGGTDGTVQLWDAESRTATDSQAACMANNVVWLSSEVILVDCDDRFVFFNSNLERRGEMFLVPNGLAAVATGQGVYASPPLIKDNILTFRDAENLGTTILIPVATMRQALFHKQHIWSRFQDAAASAYQWIKVTHISLGYWAYVVWLSLLWSLTALSAVTMWIFFPSRLAWCSMPKAGGQPLPPRDLFPWRHVSSFITLFALLGKGPRPLKKWLQKNRNLLERECFTERDPVREREKYWPIELERIMNEFSQKIKGDGRGLVWIAGVGGSGKSALAMYIFAQEFTWHA